ncbi:hypothetical protein DFA_02403 [Cavenderia fasciculata]|uniref:F-box domain-containing protein n=1 Tax=Cavenderia fasciculata TaxID=261658 RepID=F4PZC7_CACFS|nr:uncharacterized protein DFA_02403 [Cavenderia fasciculata]EGG19156.1 hypothetical protein DFA_02403 [Cavenderia fasciculata]|eukprot:XP_004366789.1 hypothetical protein DFA_02403 [Cavenderia fasciculata]
MSSILRLSNLLLLHIITSIDNVDIICLLLTCKQLYYNISIRRLITFKGIETIDTKSGFISDRFAATFNQFHLNSFKDILEDRIQSIKDQQIFLPDQDKDLVDEYDEPSNITTAFVIYGKLESIDELYQIPSIDTLCINGQQPKDMMDLSSISLLPNLERLYIHTNRFEIDQHPSLKYMRIYRNTGYYQATTIHSLDKLVSLVDLSFKQFWVSQIGPCLFPISLVFLTLRLTDIPQQDTFLSLNSLVKLKIYYEINNEEEVYYKQHPCIDLSSLLNLKTFKSVDMNDEDTEQCIIEIRVPPLIKILVLQSEDLRVPSQYPMPLLEKLYVNQSLLMNGRFSILSSPLIKKLSLFRCSNPLLSNHIPSSVEKLTISSPHIIDEPTSSDILGQIVFPPSLTHLSILGNHYEPIQFPQSLVKLKHIRHRWSNLDDQASTESITPFLPRHLKKLVWGSYLDTVTNLVFPSSDRYPPHETLNLNDINGDFTIDIPPITKYLSIRLKKTTKLTPDGIPIYSIASKISKTIITTDQQRSQQQWLPHNTTHLTLVPKRKINWKRAFKLDEIINHTNVRYLSFIIDRFVDKKLEFSIQRLDPDNKYLLVLERHILLGGIITQRKSIQNQEQYDPIYLYLDFNYTSSPFKFNWRFGQ